MRTWVGAKGVFDLWPEVLSAFGNDLPAAGDFGFAAGEVGISDTGEVVEIVEIDVG